MGRGGWSGAVLSGGRLVCVHDSNSAGVMVVAVSMFVNVGRHRVAGGPGGSLSK